MQYPIIKGPWVLILALFFFSCSLENKTMHSESETFADDYGFLRRHKEVTLLSRDSMKVAIVGDYQARVMTSSSKGMKGRGYGWMNHDLIASGKTMPHINALGGEERFWLGPEGGQYSIFFNQGDPFDLDHWQTPGAIDTMGYALREKQNDRAVFEAKFSLRNYTGMDFQVALEREIRLLSNGEAKQMLGTGLEGLSWVGYETINTLTNVGEMDWDKSTGVLSIWLLGMMKASPDNVVVIPYRKGGAGQVNDTYFGKVPADRLVKKDSVLFFKGDAQYRSKIGIPPSIVKPVVGAYDSKQKVLTLVLFSFKGDTDYVNSMWEIQEFPYQGDVANSYNDGVNALGKKMGDFYEIESSSPAVALKRGETLTHRQQTFHIEGDEDGLNKIAVRLLGVGLEGMARME